MRPQELAKLVTQTDPTMVPSLLAPYADELAQNVRAFDAAFAQTVRTNPLNGSIALCWLHYLELTDGAFWMVRSHSRILTRFGVMFLRTAAILTCRASAYRHVSPEPATARSGRRD